MLMSLHFWRVRKDGGLTLPKKVHEVEAPKVERVTTIPYLVRRETVFAVVWIAVLLTWSMLVPAPLEEIANPQISPNPAKAPWYFMGIQELLLHFHPLVGAVLIPLLAMGALALLPFYDFRTENIGVYLRTARGRALSLVAAGLSMILTPAWVLLDEFVLDWPAWLAGWPTLLSNGFVPLSLILLGLFGLDDLIKRKGHASLEERVLFHFIFLLTSLVILTLIGIFFRGHGMALVWPWAG